MPEIITPAAPEAERVVIASLIYAWTQDGGEIAIETLGGDSFYTPELKLIYGAIRGILERGLRPDLPTVCHELSKSGDTQSEGVVFELAETATTANLAHYCGILRDHETLRAMLDMARETTIECQSADANASGILSTATDRLFKLGDTRKTGKFDPMKILVPQTMDDIEAYQRGPVPGVIKTGFDLVDKWTGGLNPGDLVILAGRPSMGKTALAMCIARSVAERYPVAVFSMEMTKRQITQRLISAEARVSDVRIRSGRLSRAELDRIGITSGNIYNLPIHIDDTPGLTHIEIRSKARRIRRKENVGLIVIDYMQLMSGTGKPGENRQSEISEISRNIKQIAKECGVPIIALSQLSRAVEQRGGDRRPQLSDLKESGGIEQDADLVAFVYREHYYYPEKVDKRNEAEIIIAKQRNGPVGSIQVQFEPEYARFDNMPEKQESEF